MLSGTSTCCVMTAEETICDVMVLDVAKASVMTAAITTSKVMVLDLSTADVKECL